MGWLFHCNLAGTLKNHMLPIPCSVSPSDNYMIIEVPSFFANTPYYETGELVKVKH